MGVKGTTTMKTKTTPEKVILRRSKDPNTKQETITVIWAERAWEYPGQYALPYNDISLCPPESRKGDWLNHQMISCDGKCDLSVIHSTTKAVHPDEKDAKDTLKVLRHVFGGHYKVAMKMKRNMW